MSAVIDPQQRCAEAEADATRPRIRTRPQAFRSVRGRLAPENSRTRTDADH